MTGLLFKGIPKADARGDFRCPRMIDCSKVCQGFPYKCVDGKCICGESKETQVFNSASQLEARVQPEESCASTKDCNVICPHSTKCVNGQCVCEKTWISSP